VSARRRTAAGAHNRVAHPPAQPFTGALASRSIFLSRFRRAAAYAFALVAVTLAVGMIGYRALEHLSWLDAFHQSALLLSGMGPVIDKKSDAGKLFDGVYALFCGVILLASTGLMFAPVIHRLLHRFHLEDARD
jgi:intracellular septation protein A